MRTELRDVAPGLWLWRVEHPDWSPEAEWEPLVTSTCVSSSGEVTLLDPIAPPDDATDVWERLDADPPTLRALLELPFEHGIVSHGEPVHGRTAYERALQLPPWSG